MENCYNTLICVKHSLHMVTVIFKETDEINIQICSICDCDTHLDAHPCTLYRTTLVLITLYLTHKLLLCCQHLP